ncbi:MAG: translation initiation factor IF-3 [Actinobacteria bacterium]|nr:MAG: translation initiation factor IF-3 [Actinomycetota bacterium]
MNDRIRSPRVRLVGADGSQIGVVDTREALRQAHEVDLDLVEVAPQADPPVCRIMDYGKFKYERDVRQKEARKKQSRTGLKEIKFRPKIDPHDYATKKGHVTRFLEAGNKVKITIMFRGREMAHTDLGRRILASRSAREGTGTPGEGADGIGRRPRAGSGRRIRAPAGRAPRGTGRGIGRRVDRTCRRRRPTARPPNASG